jgi:hypothetical protein
MVASLSKQPRTAILNPGFLATNIDKGFLFSISLQNRIFPRRESTHRNPKALYQSGSAG